MATTPNSFPNLEDIMDNARDIVVDAYNNGVGEILTDDASFTVGYINSSFYELMERLENNSVTTMTIDNFQLIGLEPVAQDPSVQTYLGFGGYGGYTNTFTITQVAITGNVATFTTGTTQGLKATMPITLGEFVSATFLNGQVLTVLAVNDDGVTFTATLVNANYGPSADTGVAVNTLDPTICLPADMSAPQFLWERETGTNHVYTPMTQPQEGLASRFQVPTLRDWEWRDNAIWFLGATTPRDIRIRYTRNEAKIAPNSVTPFVNVTLDLAGCFNALSYMIAWRHVKGRNPETAPDLAAKAEYFIREMVKRAVRQKQGINYGRASYGGGRRGNLGSRGAL